MVLAEVALALRISAVPDRETYAVSIENHHNKLSEEERRLARNARARDRRRRKRQHREALDAVGVVMGTPRAIAFYADRLEAGEIWLIDWNVWMVEGD